MTGVQTCALPISGMLYVNNDYEHFSTVELPINKGVDPPESTQDSLIELISKSQSGRNVVYKVHIYRMSQNVDIDYDKTNVDNIRRKFGVVDPAIKDTFEVSEDVLDKNGSYYAKVYIRTVSPKAKITFNYSGVTSNAFIGATDLPDDAVENGILVPVKKNASIVEIPYTVVSEDGSVRSANILVLRVLSVSAEAEWVQITGATTTYADGPFVEMSTLYPDLVERIYYKAYVSAEDIRRSQNGEKTHVTVKAKTTTEKTKAILMAEDGSMDPGVTNPNALLPYIVSNAYDVSHVDYDVPSIINFSIISESQDRVDYDLELYRMADSNREVEAVYVAPSGYLNENTKPVNYNGAEDAYVATVGNDVRSIEIKVVTRDKNAGVDINGTNIFKRNIKVYTMSVKEGQAYDIPFVVRSHDEFAYSDRKSVV